MIIAEICLSIVVLTLTMYNASIYSDLRQLNLIKSDKRISLKRINEAISNITNDADLKRKSLNLKKSYKIYLFFFYLWLVLGLGSIFINANL